MNIKGLINYTDPIVSGATLLTVGIIISTVVGTYGFYKVKMSSNTIEVTGSAKESVVSDFGRWTINLDTQTPVNNQQVGFDRLDEATKNISAYLRGKGFDDLETPAPSVNADYTYPEKAAPILTGYTVSRQIIVRSADIEKLSELAQNISPLSGNFYKVTTGGIELTYQKLSDERVKLLSGAIKDARARADAIAKETGRSVGTLKSATAGVVQVLPFGGIEVSDYGMYDTQSKKKDVMVTVRANFTLK